jgi:hypothetical protein
MDTKIPDVMYVLRTPFLRAKSLKSFISHDVSSGIPVVRGGRLEKTLIYFNTGTLQLGCSVDC